MYPQVELAGLEDERLPNIVLHDTIPAGGIPAPEFHLHAPLITAFSIRMAALGTDILSRAYNQQQA